MAQFEVRPRRALGQNFLIDSNILGVIGRAAELAATDVVLEIGGGLGVLSEYLAARVGHLHVVELDRGLEPALRDALGPFTANSTLHLTDAMQLDLAGLDPPPSKIVANLPYGIAANVILRTIEEIDTASLWLAMVQREVGERLAATPADRAQYGIPSALAQLACEVKVVRGVPRSVFYPVPRVDSVLVRLVRHGPAPPPELRAFVRAAFAHRRKTLASSVAQSGAIDPDRVRGALATIGKPPGLRAESLSPVELRSVWELL
ncbi:MAG TPA: 16S rRNA (adenine(1518)-N(6)/adenine(1519)-N(6))-dimethyltransferase RsmA [Solirubrobacteraceae bacterium]|nr:16S rRNA (adenine(1518)-N(6)/adenine(1519)-N(6))-dimethyltransferase RsmA [Solirubrobacteraceae bacterium]